MFELRSPRSARSASYEIKRKTSSGHTSLAFATNASKHITSTNNNKHINNIKHINKIKHINNIIMAVSDYTQDLVNLLAASESKTLTRKTKESDCSDSDTRRQAIERCLQLAGITDSDMVVRAGRGRAQTAADDTCQRPFFTSCLGRFSIVNASSAEAAAKKLFRVNKTAPAVVVVDMEWCVSSRFSADCFLTQGFKGQGKKFQRSRQPSARSAQRQHTQSLWC